jgi:hypothetical protein
MVTRRAIRVVRFAVIAVCIPALSATADDLFGIRGGRSGWGDRVSDAVKPDEGDKADVAYLQKPDEFIGEEAKPYVYKAEKDASEEIDGIEFSKIRWWFVNGQLRYISLETKKHQRDRVIAWLDKSAERLVPGVPKGWLSDSTMWRFDRNLLVQDQLIMTDAKWFSERMQRREKDKQMNAVVIGEIKWSCKKDDSFVADDKAAAATDFLRTSRPPVLPTECKPFTRMKEDVTLGKCEIEAVRYWFVGESLVAISVQTKKEQREEVHKYLEQKYDKQGTEMAAELGQGGLPLYYTASNERKSVISYWQCILVPDQVVFTKMDAWIALMRERNR